jgi:hypothetical protein
MKIIQRAEWLEVQDDDGTILKQFFFDDNATRRAVSGRPTRKRAFQEAQTYAGKGHTVEWPKK